MEYGFRFLDCKGTVRDFLRKNREGKRDGYYIQRDREARVWLRVFLVFLYEMDLMEYYKTLWVLWNNTLK